jgi:hypothetical protein
MKTLKLRTCLEDINGVETVLTTYILLKTAINAPPANGFTIQEIEQRVGLLKIIDRYKELFDYNGKKKEEIEFSFEAEVVFEDVEFEKLRSIFNECKWGTVSGLIVKTAADLSV